MKHTHFIYLILTLFFALSCCIELRGDIFNSNECDDYRGPKFESIDEIKIFIKKLDKKNLDSVYNWNCKLLCSSIALDYKKGIAEACNNLGYYYYAKHDLSNADKYLFRAQSLSKTIDYSEGVAASHCYYGLLNEQIQNYENALVHYNEVYELGVKEENARWHGDALINIGKIHLIGKNYIDAENYLNESIEVLMELGRIPSLGWSYAHLGKLYSEKKDVKKAFECFEKANQIMLENNFPRWSSYILNDIGLLYEDVSPEKCLYYLQKALKLSTDNEYYIQVLETNFQIGNFYFKKDLYSTANEYFNKTYKLGLELNNLEYLEKSTEKIAMIYSKENNHLKANKYFKENINYKKQILEIKSKETFSWLASEREMLKMELENVNLENENENKARIIGSQKNNNILLVIIVILSLVLIVALSNLLQVRKKANLNLKIANQDLLDKLEEIKENADKIIESNKRLEDEKSELESELKSKLLVLLENQSQLKHLSNEIRRMDIDIYEKGSLLTVINSQFNSNTLSSIDEEYFKMNQDFFAVLCKLHPNLTSKNLKLCSYIRLDLTSKEIASLLFISIASVKVARSRLRKKLNLPKEDITLISYFNSIDPKGSSAS